MSEELIKNISDVFEEKFSRKPLIVLSPGRINLIGEHTDYNNGLVFPAAIDKYIVVALSKSDNDFSTVYSVDFEEYLKIDFNNLNKLHKGGWKNYVIGVVAGILETGKPLGNFDLIFGGDIPIGAGMSSSAALENGIVFGLNELFGLNLTPPEIMNISIDAEHNFAGTECGVMDQFSNLHGKEGNAILLDCSDLSYDYIPIIPEDYQFLLINTNVKRQLSNSPYNQRKKACKTGLETIRKQFPKVESLGKATATQLNSVKNKLSSEVYNRCMYVIEENERVKLSKEALQNNDWHRFGELLFASHRGLSELYEVSLPELDFLVGLAKEDPAVLGARMMGGGFGGCTINLIEKNSVNRFIEKVQEEYQLKFGLRPDFYEINITDGIKIYPGTQRKNIK